MNMFWIVPFGLVILATVSWLIISPTNNGVIIWLIVINVMAFLLYGYDKFMARIGQTRIPEKVLLAFAFMGGWPLAFVSMRLFHHKTSDEKTAFLKTFWIMVILEILLFVILFWIRKDIVSNI